MPGLFSCFELEDVDDAAGDRATVKVGLAGRAELYGSYCKREEGVIITDATVLAGHDLGTTLTNKYFTDLYLLTV